MAVIKHFRALVSVNHQYAKEYRDKEEPDPNLRYIEAISGARFKIRISFSRRFNVKQGEGVIIYVNLDGKRATSVLANAEWFRTATTLDKCIKGCIRRSEGVLKFFPFKFGNIQTREMLRTDSIAELKDKYQDLGIIKVVMKRVKYWLSELPIVHDEFDQKNLEAIPEQALKGRPIEIGVTYGTGQTIKDRMRWDMEPFNEPPLATFIFKYRSKKALQSLLILETSPIPKPLEERPIEQLTRRELEELVRNQKRQLQQRQTTPVIKREDKPIKRERSDSATTSTRPPKMTRGSKNEVIYHLDTDSEPDISQSITQEQQTVHGSSRENRKKIKPEIEVITLD